MRTAEKYALAVVSGVAAAELLSFGVEAAVQWFWSYIDRCNVKELEGEFQILNTLGRWGMRPFVMPSGKTSKIYKAENRKRGRTVALKVLSKLSVVAIESNAFTVEREILQSITHPNIVHLYSAFSRGWCNVLEMECVLTKRRGPVGIGECKAMVNGEVACTAELTFAIHAG